MTVKQWLLCPCERQSLIFSMGFGQQTFSREVSAELLQPLFHTHTSVCLEVPEVWSNTNSCCRYSVSSLLCVSALSLYIWFIYTYAGWEQPSDPVSVAPGQSRPEINEALELCLTPVWLSELLSEESADGDEEEDQKYKHLDRPQATEEEKNCLRRNMYNLSN